MIDDVKAEARGIMATWRYVGCNNRYVFWTNETDAAELGWGYFEYAEIEDYPHPNAAIYYGNLQDQYNGDVIAFLRDMGADRENLNQFRQRFNVC